LVAAEYVGVSELIPFVSVYTVFSGLSATVTGLLAVYVYRQYATDPASEAAGSGGHPDLVRPFLVMLTVFVVSAFGYALVTVDGATELGFGLATIVLVSVPWSVFALRYAGWGYLITRARIALFAIPVLAVTALMAGPVLTGISVEAIPGSVRLAISFAQLGIVGVVFVTVGFILFAAYRHGTLTLTSGLTVVLPVALLLFVSQVTRPRVPVFSTTVLTGSYVVLAATLVTSVTRYDVLETRPGTGMIGERLVVEKMDEVVLVVDREGDIVRANETAEQVFGPDIEGRQFADVFGRSLTRVSEGETIEHWTDSGRMRFDPRISALTNSRDRTLGHAVTLIDVTDREIRRQRIQVLNRILRHNLRNNVDVIKATAEIAAEDRQSADSPFETIYDAAEELEGLSLDARRIQDLITDSEAPKTPVEIESTLQTVVETVVETRRGQATVTIDAPPVTVQTNERLLLFALENVVENAVEHTDSAEPRVEIRGSVTGTGVRVRVLDDGPGIPESEREVLETGREEPLAHATSMGLWATKWAVETLGGTLSIGESDLGGAAVCLDLPGGEADDT
jgi:signal transduction histidine kinase